MAGVSPRCRVSGAAFAQSLPDVSREAVAVRREQRSSCNGPRDDGRTSIKVVLPAVWRSSAALRTHPWFAAYLQLDAQGCPLDPYKALPPLPLGEADGDDDAITDGTGAIRVYQDLIFRHEADPQFRENRRRLLLQYCELDTAAIVMIWRHWL